MQTLDGQTLRDAARLVRQRVRPTYDTITAEQARLAGYVAVTSSYSTRHFEQCEMLDRVIRDFATCDTVLVRNAAGNKIEVWRKKS